MTNTFREHLQRAIFETFELWDIWSEWWGNMTWPTKRQQRRQTQWQWQKFRVWPLIHCYESDSSRPNWWGLTKFHNFRQISQFWPISQFQPNFTILEYLKYLEYLELGQFCNFCDVSSTISQLPTKSLMLRFHTGAAITGACYKLLKGGSELTQDIDFFRLVKNKENLDWKDNYQRRILWRVYY